MIDYLFLAVTCFMIGYTTIKSRDFFALYFMVMFLFCFVANPSPTLSKLRELFDIAAYLLTIVITVVSGLIVGSKSPDHWKLKNKKPVTEPKAEPKKEQS